MKNALIKQINNKQIATLVEKYQSAEFSSLNKQYIISDKYLILPGFCDVHVHFREPGFSYKGTIYDGTRAGARGGYTRVLTMPNLNPVPDSLENLNKQLEIIEKDAIISVTPYGAITKSELGKELADLDALAPYVCAFSDDGKGVQTDAVMKEAMLKAKSLNKMIVAHCEDNSLLFGGYIHDGEYAKSHGHRGICSASEYKQIERDIALVKQTGVSYHVCHVSTKESVALIRKAKADGVDITCETAPHYLVLTDSDLKEEGRYKMNPPLRAKEDRQALIEGILDGTIDMIATDHAPHSAEEKSNGLEKSPFGIVGLETAFAVLYTNLVKKGILSIERLIELVCINPRKRFSLPTDDGDFTVFNIKEEYIIDSKEFLSKGRATPFDGDKVFGECMLTVHNGKIVYQKN